MDPLRDINKASSTQTMVEDMDTKINLSLKSIKSIGEIILEVIETRLIHPSRIITLTKGFCATC